VFYTIIQLIAPYLPHITEEIYQDYFKKDIPAEIAENARHSIHKTTYPTVE
jgi:valyl-tRNA synthetase